MDTYQQISELAAELRDAYLTKAERQAAIQQLHELQHDLELDEVEAIDNGDSERAALLYAEWQKIENVLAA
jgi:pantothenate synthetase